MHNEQEKRANKQMSHLIEWPRGTTISIFPLPHVCKITVSSPVHNLSGRKLPQQTGQLSRAGIETATGALPVVKKENKQTCFCSKEPLNQSSRSWVPAWVKQSDNCTNLPVGYQCFYVVPKLKKNCNNSRIWVVPTSYLSDNPKLQRPE